VTNLENVIFFL